MKKRAKAKVVKNSTRMRIFAVLLLAIVLLSFFIGISFWKWYVFSIKEVPIEVAVTNTTLLGFNAGTDKLYFGTLAPESFSERKTAINSSYDSIVVFKMHGTAGDWVTVSANHVHLLPNIQKDIVIRMTIPSGTPVGNYSGTATVEYHRRMFWE